MEYRKPPIQEAVIDLMFRQPQTIARLEKAVKKLAPFYPNQVPMVNQEVQVESSEQGPPRVHVRSESAGFQLASHDQANIVSIYKDRLATSRIAPYEGWDKLKEQAGKNWHLVVRSLGVVQVNRIGIRYVNRIDIPLKGSKAKNLDEYLRLVPNVDSYSANAMTEFVYLVARPTDLPNWSARLVTSLVPSPLIEHISLGFDIDVFRTESIPTKEDKLWETVDEARAVKNEIFEMYITSKSRELFNA